MSKSSRSTLSYIALDPSLNSSLVHLPLSLYAPLTQRSVPPQNIVIQLEVVTGSNGPSTNGPKNDPTASSEAEAEPDGKYYVGWSGMSSAPLSTSSFQSQSFANNQSAPSLQTVLTLSPSLASLIKASSPSTSSNHTSLESSLIKITLLRSPPLPTASKIEVTPLTPDDWEILSLHAEEIEGNMLGQVRAARKGMNIMVSTGASGRTRCTFRVDSTDPPTASSSYSPDAASLARAVRLSTDTEVIIAPKLRSNPSPPESHSLNDLKGTRSKVQPSSQSQKEQLETQGKLRRMLWRVLPLDWEPCNLMSQDETVPHPVGVILPPSRKQEGSNVFDLLSRAFPYHRCAVTKEPCPAASSTSFKNPSTGDSSTRKSSKGEAADEGAKGNDTQSSRIRDDSSVEDDEEGEETEFGIEHQTSLPRRPTASSQFSASPAYVSARDESSSSYINKEVLWPERHVWLDFKLRKSLGIGAGELVRFTSPPPFSSSQQVSGSEPKHQLKTSKSRKRGPSLAGVDALLECSTNLIRDTFRARTLLEATSTNGNKNGNASSIRSGSSGMLLVGGPGSGKTSICDSISFRLNESFSRSSGLSTGSISPPIKTIKVSCSPFSEERLPLLRNRISSWLLECSWNSPTLLILEDLDRLCPAEQEHSDSTRSKQIAENLISALKQCIERDDVFVLITSQNETSLHERIRNSKVINRIMKLKPPSKEGRKQILELVVNEKCGRKAGEQKGENEPRGSNGIQPKDLNYVTLAGSTEGYLPRDLKDLTDRAVHQAVMRANDSRFESEQQEEEDEKDGEQEQPEDRGAEDEAPIFLLPSDFIKAQEGFTPLSLRDISLAESSIAWSDIGGLQSTRRVLRETLEWPTKYSAIFNNCPLRLRSGLLLYGFPGCGKTLLASAVAKECGLNFISVKGPEILNKYIGASEKSVRDLFDRAQAAKPCVLFFDEFDSIAPKRGHDSTGVTDRVVNQLLTQMDGAEGLDGVYVLAATSRPDLIDAALLRPGRLDKSLLCDMPDLEDRLDIMRAVSPKINLGKEVDLRKWAEKTEGFSGADLQALLYNANLETIHENIEQVRKNEEGAATEAGEIPGGNGNEAERKIQFIKLGGGGRRKKADLKGKDKQKESHGVTELTSNSVEMSGAERQALQRKLDLMIENSISNVSPDHASNKGSHEGFESENKKKSKAFVLDSHIEKSLASTRPSVPAEEVRRLRRIYREFAGDERDGGFPDGEGSREVGARETLM